MLKKSASKLRTIIIATFLCVGLMSSATATLYSPQASYYLSYYAATADTGSFHRVSISFDVDATGRMDLVGASFIVVQEKINGVWTGVETYYGSTQNGMLAASAYSHVGSINYVGTSGKEYRALVTVYAGNGTGSDSRTIATNSVTV